MALKLLEYPVKHDPAIGYLNVFPAYRPLYCRFRAIGNTHLNWFMEIRYIVSNAGQTPNYLDEIISNYDRFQASPDGYVIANVTRPSDLIVPDFSVGNGKNKLDISYKIQYRESYDGYRNGPWTSPPPVGTVTTDIPITLVHASVPVNTGLTDEGMTKRFTKGYPLMYSYIHSNKNDNLKYRVNRVQFFYKELTVSQGNPYGGDANEFKVGHGDITGLNGVYIIMVDTRTFHEDTFFVVVRAEVTSDKRQYNSLDYDPGDYA